MNIQMPNMTRFAMLLLFTSTLSNASNIPDYFSEQADQEYRATLEHLQDLMPRGGHPMALAGLGSPFNILDVHGTKLPSLKARSEFANFNLGVMSGVIFRAPDTLAVALPNRVLCHQSSCKKPRLDSINAFLTEKQQALKFFKQHNDIQLIQRSDDVVFRVNNSFFTPAGAIEYTPSRHAGFIPSAQYTKHTPVDVSPRHVSYAKRSESIRQLMAKYHIKAIVRQDANGIDVIFDGISDNHWGVKIIGKGTAKPEIDDRNRRQK